MDELSLLPGKIFCDGAAHNISRTTIESLKSGFSNRALRTNSAQTGGTAVIFV
jgi:hypothetical protein